MFEYVDYTVLQLLKACPGPGLPVPQVQSIVWQLARALAHLHKKKVGNAHTIQTDCVSATRARQQRLRGPEASTLRADACSIECL